MKLIDAKTLCINMSDEEKEDIFIRRKQWTHDHYCYFVKGDTIKGSDIRYKKPFADIASYDSISICSRIDMRDGHSIKCGYNFSKEEVEVDDWEIVDAAKWITGEGSAWYI